MNVSTINLSTLPSLPLNERGNLPKVPAIYFALDTNNAIVYIGKARRLIERWRGVSHHRYGELSEMSGIRLTWLVVSDPVDLDDIETACIAHFSPLLNGKIVQRNGKGPKRLNVYIPDKEAAILEWLTNETESGKSESEAFLSLARRAARGECDPAAAATIAELRMRIGSLEAIIERALGNGPTAPAAPAPAAGDLGGDWTW